MAIDLSKRPIGIFDSGIGGLTVANAVFSLLPQESIIYIGDTARIPYGNKTQDQIRQFSFEIISKLLSKGCKIIVVACNTASAAALNAARVNWPNIEFIGMEPALKPAVEQTKNGVIGILATAGTFKSQRYANLIQEYAQNVQLYQNPCKGLVQLIEQQKVDHPDTLSLLKSILLPMLEKEADTFVLGCTHYPFVLPLIEQILQSKDNIIDPVHAIARQIQRKLASLQLLNSGDSTEHQFYATGDSTSMEWAISYLTDIKNVHVNKYPLNP